LDNGIFSIIEIILFINLLNYKVKIYMSDSNLSEREKELLRLVTTGASNKEISHQLNISINTVKVHLQNIYTKLGITSRTEAAMWAVQNGLVIIGEKVIDESNDVDTKQLSGRFLNWFTQFPALLRLGIFMVFLLLLFTIIWGSRIFLRQFIYTRTTINNIDNSIFDDGQWKILEDMPTARSNFAAVVFGNHIYAIAGLSNSGVIGVNERYDLSKGAWDSLIPKPNPVMDVKAGAIGGLIYVPGGRLENKNVTDILEIYDPSEDIWIQGAHLPNAISAYGLATFEGKLFVFGGWNGTENVNIVYMYEPEDDRWTVQTSMPTILSDINAVTVKDSIFVIGNKEIGTIAEVYSPISDFAGSESWTSIPPLPLGWQALGVENVAGNIYILSSNSRNNMLIHEIDPQNNEVRELENSIRSYVSDFCMVALGQEITLLGGISNEKFQTQNTSYQVIYRVSIPIVR
jgi:DNA-binding CsgD family transcriptional regulator